ncbi:MAG TPA: hypothetical protein VF203_10270 [Burkholderiales bacterium]
MPQSTANTANRNSSSGSSRRAAPYRLARVEKVEVPEAGGHWYRYVLENGRSTITGQRRGSLKDVTAHAHRYAEQLNSRAFGSHSVWSTRRDAKAKAR